MAPVGLGAESTTWLGQIVGIYVTPGAGQPMTALDEVRAIAGKGLEGDRYAMGVGKYSGVRLPDDKRAVTLIEREAIENAVDQYGVELSDGETRRNLVTTGIALNHLIGQEFTVGEVRLRGVDLSHPCVYLEGLTRDGVREMLVHRGGLRAEILTDGPIRVGDSVRPG
jgi:MOSC domain-containing protein YiiM